MTCQNLCKCNTLVRRPAGVTRAVAPPDRKTECLAGRVGSSLVIRATWNGAVLAESDDTIVVEGNHYFPPGAVHGRYLRESDTHTRCPWKGTASYYTLVVNGQENPDGAWYYPDPSRAARHIAGRIAFWRGVDVKQVADSATTGEHNGTPGNQSLLGRLLRR